MNFQKEYLVDRKDVIIMDEIEIQIFDEINDYKEKIGIMTFRQWLFFVLIVIVVVPTYILLPKYTFINSQIASYIVIIEAGIIGFVGFVKIHNLPAEKIIPFWYRHYFVFGKPIKYMTIKDYQKLQEEKKNKKNNKTKNKIIINPEKDDSELTPKQLKAKTKQQKELQKAKKKYGYLFKEDNNTPKLNDDKQEKDMAEAEQQNNCDEIIVVDVEKEQDELKNNMKDDSSLTNSEVINILNIKNQHSEVKNDEHTEINNKGSDCSNNETSESIELDNKLNSLSDEEKRVLLKLLGK